MMMMTNKDNISDDIVDLLLVIIIVHKRTLPNTSFSQSFPLVPRFLFVDQSTIIHVVFGSVNAMPSLRIPNEYYF